MFQLDTLLRPHIAALVPYSSARDEYTGTVGVFLDANENPLGSTTTEGDYNRYPDPHQQAIKQQLAPIKGVSGQHRSSWATAPTNPSTCSYGLPVGRASIRY